MGIRYSVETDPDTTAKAIIRDRPISPKHAQELAREIKGRTAEEAVDYLDAVIREERSVPFRTHNSGVGHRRDIDGWDAGRYPQKAAEAYLDLLENAVGNADYQGFDGETMTIAHVAAHKVGERRGRKPRAFGRATPWNTPLVDVELVLEGPAVTEEEEDTD